MLSKFEREEALKDLVFRWVARLTHKVLRSVYSLLINLIGLALHMTWYMQHLQWLVVEWVRTNRGNDEEHDESCFEESFGWLR